MAELHELNPVGRFDDRAADYVRFRPTYPSAAIDLMLDGLGNPAKLVVADIGAGTGILSRLLADRHVQVLAIEPGQPMRAAAEPHANVTWHSASAESTGLAAASVDLVVCAQAFHWFRSADAILEFARILKPGARLALMWNSRSRMDPFTAGYRQAIRDVEGERVAERTEFDAARTEAVAEAAHGRRLLEPFTRRVFPNQQRLDLAGLIGRSHSASYVPKTGPRGERLLELLTALHRRFADANGFVTLVYETEVYVAHKR